MNDLQEMMIFIASCLENQNQAISFESIKNNPGLLNYKEAILENEIKTVLEDGLLELLPNYLYKLTEKGKQGAGEIRKKRTRMEFENHINRALSSKAYLDFCEEVYGYRMYLFNMMDRTQLDYIFNSMPVTKNDTVVDLGCGIGSILNHIADKYGCEGIGIDQLNTDTVQKSGNKLQYIEGDMDRFQDYGIKPKATILVDSLYFCEDMEALITSLKSIKDNKLYIFFSQYVFDQQLHDNSILKPQGTSLAQVLNKLKLNYSFIDYSTNEKELYDKAMKILPGLKQGFEDEGNIALYEKRMREDGFGKELYDKGLAARYLYIVE